MLVLRPQAVLTTPLRSNHSSRTSLLMLSRRPRGGVIRLKRNPSQALLQFIRMLTSARLDYMARTTQGHLVSRRDGSLSKTLDLDRLLQRQYLIEEVLVAAALAVWLTSATDLHHLKA